MSIHDHMISGLGNDPASVRRVLAQTENSRGVLLYFHGGLSSEHYMETKLGPWLMQSAFQSQNLDGLYPIFVNYKASLFEPEKLRELLEDMAFRRLLDRVRDYLGMQSEKFSPGVGDEEEAIRAASLAWLASAQQKQTLDEESVAELLADPSAQETLVARVLDTDPALQGVVAEIAAFATQKGIVSIPPVKVAVVAVRIAARFAIRTNHEIVPTLLEEIIRQLQLLGIDLGEFTQDHWDMVYDHAIECWQPGNNGHHLLLALRERQQRAAARGEQFAIKVMSHSAGAIVICRLIERLQREDLVTLDDVIMVAPAVNQKVFAETMLTHRGSWRDFRAYVLTEHAEERDSIAFGLYPASLLYFVSGVAERYGLGDRMLLIARHLDATRTPYRKSWYQRVFGRSQGDPDIIWQHFDRHPEQLVYCPNDSSEPGVGNDGSGHENTKLLWLTPRLGQALIWRLTDGQVTDPDIPVPAGSSG